MTGLIWTAAVWGGLLLYVRRRRSDHPTLADWLSRENMALVVALLGTYSIAVAGEAEEVLADPLVIERIARGGLAVLALAMIAPLLARRIRSYTPGRRAMTGLLAYMGVALVSTVYSAAAVVTLPKVVELTAGLAPIVAIALGPDAARRLRNTVSLVIALATSLLGVAIVGFFALPSVFSIIQSRPGFVLTETLVSPFAHNNTLAAHGAIIAVFALAMLLSGTNQPRLWMAVSGIGVANVVLASGRQGVAMIVAGAAVVLWARRRVLFLGLLGPGTGAAVYAYRDVLFDALSRDRPENFTNFTGRLYWWEAAVEAWSVHPWTGYGYAAGGRFVALASIGGGSRSSVHSGFVEALVGVGVIGLIGLLYTLAAIVAWSARALKTETALAVLIVPLVLRTAVSQGFGGWLNIEFVLFALLAAVADETRIARRRTRGRVESPSLPTLVS